MKGLNTAVTLGLATALALAAALLPPAPRLAADEAIQVTQDRVYREGVFLVVDALVENHTGAYIDGVEATVVFLDFFDALVRAEHTVLSPVTLAPGQTASLRVAVPYSDAVRKLEYRFTWRQQGVQLQSSVRRDIWKGSAVR
jgi:hypothetical protein